MRRVIIESPFAGSVKKNTEYARRCVSAKITIKEAWGVARLWRWRSDRLLIHARTETTTEPRDVEPPHEPINAVEFRKEPAERDGRPGVEVVGSYDGVDECVEYYPR